MKRIVDIRTEESLNTLKQTLKEIAVSGEMNLTLRKVHFLKTNERTKEGEVVEQETENIQKTTLTSEVNPTIRTNISNGFFYLTVHVTDRDVMFRLRKLWQAYLDGNTNDIFDGSIETHLFSVDCVKIYETKDLVYILSCRNPVFFTLTEGDECLFVFRQEEVLFDKATVDMVEVIDEADYENSLSEDGEIDSVIPDEPEKSEFNENIAEKETERLNDIF